MFRVNLLVPVSRVKKSVRENRAQGKLTLTIIFYGTLLVEEAHDFGIRLHFHFQAENHVTWLTLIH